MLTNIEDNKKIYVIESTNSGNEYSLMILKEKKEEAYRIINLTVGHICPCKFDTYEQAEADIYRYQSEGKNKIIDIHSITI